MTRRTLLINDWIGTSMARLIVIMQTHFYHCVLGHAFVGHHHGGDDCSGDGKLHDLFLFCFFVGVFGPN